VVRRAVVGRQAPLDRELPEARAPSPCVDPVYYVNEADEKKYK